MSSSATGVGMPICFLGDILLILTQKSSQKFGDVLGIMRLIRCYAHSCMKKHKERLKYVILRGSETYRTHLFIPASLLFFVILLHFGIP